MDDRRFDEWARLLGAPGSRRAALRGLAAAVAFPGVAWPGDGDQESAEARPAKKRKKKCPKSRKCGKRCCPKGLTCRNGACGRCTPSCNGKECGDDGCGGSCSPGCGGGLRCLDGHCADSGPCRAGERDCGGVCIPDDDDHCCAQADCGDGASYSRRCNTATHRCECVTAGWGRCPAPYPRFCGPCCPGGNEVCPGELQCVASAYGGCACPASLTQCRRDDRCRLIESDRDACGPDCVRCFDGGACCGGECVDLRGCRPGEGGSRCWTGARCGACERVVQAGEKCCDGRIEPIGNGICA